MINKQINLPIIIEWDPITERWNYHIHRAITQYDLDILKLALQFTWVMLNRKRFTTLELADGIEGVYDRNSDQIKEITRVLRKIGGTDEESN